jgi:hypothetical protein
MDAMRKILSIVGVICMLGVTGLVASAAPAVAPLPRTLVNARYVYVAAYDGDQFSPNLLPEDRHAISAVQDAIQKSGKFTLVYQAGQADILILVQSRPSEDVLAVYDGHSVSSQYLWRVMGRSGLQENETPLVKEFLQAFDKAEGKTSTP